MRLKRVLACRILSRELKDLLLGRVEADFGVDAVEDDVFHWELVISSLTPGSPLAQACLRLLTHLPASRAHAEHSHVTHVRAHLAVYSVQCLPSERCCLTGLHQRVRRWSCRGHPFGKHSC